MPNTVLVTANLTNATKKGDKSIPNQIICIYEDNHKDIFSRTVLKNNSGSELTVPALVQSVADWPGTQVALVCVLVQDQKLESGQSGAHGLGLGSATMSPVQVFFVPSSTDISA